jgi:hypothetical protein
MFRTTAQKLGVATAFAILGTVPAGQVLAQKSGEVVFGDQKPGKRISASVDAAVGYDDNTYTTSSDEVESFFSTLGANVSVTLGDTRSSLDLALGGSVTWYPDRDDEDTDYGFNFSANAFHDLNEKFDLFANADVRYESEPDYGDIFTSNRRNGDYFYSNLNVGVSAQWSQRFSTTTNLNFVTVNYIEDELEDLFNRQEYGINQAFFYALKPETSLVAEYRFRLFDQNDDSRDAYSHYTLVGIDHGFSERLKASVRAGAEFRDFETQGMQTAPYFESTLTYLGLNRSSISWVSRIGYEVTDTLDYDERFTYRTGVSWVQGLTARLRSEVGAYYQHNDYTGNEGIGNDFSEDVLSFNAGLIFAINRHLQINAGYSHSSVFSDEEFREYDRNVYSAGLKLLF